jgi:hypothetical protein
MGVPMAAQKAAVVACCTYEVAAICSRGRVPTITALNRRQRAVGWAIVAALIVHFHTQED